VGGNGFLRRGTRPPQPLIVTFIDDMHTRLGWDAHPTEYEQHHYTAHSSEPQPT
jgi:hypothetical protein